MGLGKQAKILTKLRSTPPSSTCPILAIPLETV